MILAAVLLLAGDWCGTAPGVAAELVAVHRYAGAVAAAQAPADRDLASVAILKDAGDLVIRRNPFDLDGASLRFSPDASAGYGVARLALAMDAPGDLLLLGDNDAPAIALPFAFPFFGADYREVFVHSDGNLTFGAADPLSPSLSRFLAGPPRIAGFYADLDPSRAGSVSVRMTADRVAFVWSAVPGVAQINHNTFEIALLPSGAIDVVFGSALETREAIVGLSPGGVSDLTLADLSEGRPQRSTGALVERFSETEKLDLVATGRRFFRAHPDAFDQLIVYTTRPLNPLPGSLAFEVNVRNDVRGLGVGLVDDGATWGSAHELSSVVYMDTIDSYLDVDGFEFLGHEVGHRWLAYLRFRDTSGADSPALLGRGLSHWSFFLDSDASVMEGNRLADLGGGRFESVDIARGYSALDQYAMGLRRPEEVPPFFFVADPDNFRPARSYKASSAPEAGVSFTGERRDVRVEAVIAALGPRTPDGGAAPHRWRQAFILVEDARAGANEARIAAVARIRTDFEAYFRAATGSRGNVVTALP